MPTEGTPLIYGYANNWAGFNLFASSQQAEDH
jgi:hypothetical protein